MGHTLLCMSIKAGTVKLYLKACTKLFLDNNQWDPTIIRTGSTAPVLQAVLHEAKRWEDMPNRQEPVTMEMTNFFISQAATSHPDSLTAAMADWSILGQQSGFRSSEWSQPHSNLTLPLDAPITRNIDNSATAFIASDFTLRDKHQRPLKFSLDLDPNRVEHVNTRWRFQKNNNNGEEITYSRSHSNPSHCYVRAVLRILARAARLGVPPLSPIAVALQSTGKKKKKSVTFITSSQSTKFIRQAATAVHGVTTAKALARFSNHSIRVGACVHMDAAGTPAHQIKKRLRWKSDTFMDYLRNVARLATDHNNVISKAIKATIG